MRFRQVEKLVDFLFRNAERMSFCIRIDIQESQEIVIFRNFVSRDFAVDYFGENRWHQSLDISRISNFKTPFGTVISATSPTDLPRSPRPIGDVTEIFPVFRSASLSATRVYFISMPF